MRVHRYLRHQHRPASASVVQLPSLPTEELDLLLIGCGLHGTGLLTATPELFKHRIGIVEAGPRLGPGLLLPQRVSSYAHGCELFNWVSPDGPFGDLLSSPNLRLLHEQPAAVDLPLLTRVLESFGARIQHLAGHQRVVLGDPATALHVQNGRISVCLASGRRLLSRVVALATGLREVPHVSLQPWQAKRVLSSDLLQHGMLCLARWEPLMHVAIVGASHSAYTVAKMLQRARPNRPPPFISIVHRHPVKLFHASQQALEHEAWHPLQAKPDLPRDVCPETGQIFRYSGLRNDARDTFRAIARGELPFAYHRQADCVTQATPLLNAADVVVQALGHENNLLDLQIDGVSCPLHDGQRLVDLGSDGRLLLPQAASPLIFALGLNADPCLDIARKPFTLYRQRGLRLLDTLRAAAKSDIASGHAADHSPEPATTPA